MTKTRLKNQTLWGRTYLYSLHKGVAPPRGGGGLALAQYVLNSLAIYKQTIIKTCITFAFWRFCVYSSPRMLQNVLGISNTIPFWVIFFCKKQYVSLSRRVWGMLWAGQWISEWVSERCVYRIFSNKRLPRLRAAHGMEKLISAALE